MMKKLLLLVCLCIVSISLVAQDFTTRFMQSHKMDNNLKCVTISPKMMEKVMNLNMDDGMMKMISDLKSMQMVTAKIHVKRYYHEAVALAKKNADRFLPYASYGRKKLNYEIMIRKRRKAIVELVMLMCEDDNFSVINFTGNMDRRFIDKLASSMGANSR